MPRYIALAVITAILLLPSLAPATDEEGVYSQEPPVDASTEAAPLPEPVDEDTASSVLGPDGIQRVEMTGGDYYYKPKRIILKLNVPVELTVRKAPGFVPHDIVMKAPEAGMDFKVDFGKDGEVIRFTPTLAGTFEFFCDKKLLFFKSHRERGMEGVIEVVE